MMGTHFQASMLGQCPADQLVKTADKQKTKLSQQRTLTAERSRNIDLQNHLERIISGESSLENLCRGSLKALWDLLRTSVKSLQRLCAISAKSLESLWSLCSL